MIIKGGQSRMVFNLKSNSVILAALGRCRSSTNTLKEGESKPVNPLWISCPRRLTTFCRSICWSGSIFSFFGRLIVWSESSLSFFFRTSSDQGFRISWDQGKSSIFASSLLSFIASASWRHSSGPSQLSLPRRKSLGRWHRPSKKKVFFYPVRRACWQGKSGIKPELLEGLRRAYRRSRTTRFFRALSMSQSASQLFSPRQFLLQEFAILFLCKSEHWSKQFQLSLLQGCAILLHSVSSIRNFNHLMGKAQHDVQLRSLDVERFVDKILPEDQNLQLSERFYRSKKFLAGFNTI